MRLLLWLAMSWISCSSRQKNSSCQEPIRKDSDAEELTEIRRRNLRVDKRRRCDSKEYSDISYKDRLYRALKSSLSNWWGQNSSKVSSINLSEGYEDFWDIIRDAKLFLWKKPWYFVLLFVLCLVLSVIFIGLISVDCHPSSTSDNVMSVSSPVLDKGPDKICDEMIMYIEKLKADLKDAKKKLNYQFPDPNLWPNFALESHGAKVYSKWSSKTYERVGGIKIFGVQIFSKVGPVTVIQGQYPPIPGNCWSFPGSHGNLFIELSHTIIVSHVTLDHVLNSVSPADTISSAPRHFSVYGHQSLYDTAVHLGKFTYNLNGNPTQTFAVKGYDIMTFKYIDLQIETNYGHADYTCLYGFRVHGRI